MKLALMQPYLFPYIGYFQLLACVDRFVIYDDVAFRKQSWINRNRILLDGKASPFVLSLHDASSFRLINATQILDDGRSRTKILRQITNAYRRAPHFTAVAPLLESIISHPALNLGDFLENSLGAVAAYLGIPTPMQRSSHMEIGAGLSGQARVLAFCRSLGADTYVNAIGGTELYDGPTFAASRIDLKFIKSAVEAYPQFGAPFVANLSIVDVMMFNSPEVINQVLLRQYTLI